MFVRFDQLLREGARLSGTQPLAIEAQAGTVLSVRPGEVAGYDSPCCELVMSTEEERIFVAGGIDEVLKKLGETPSDAAVRLEAIRQIVCE